MNHNATEDLEVNLRDLLSDVSSLWDLTTHIDTDIVRSAVLHGIAVQVIEYRHQMLISNPRSTNQLWLQSRQDDL